MQDRFQPPEYAAVCHILAAPAVARRAASYVREDDFDWDGLHQEAETMSGGERLLIDLAAELWSAKKTTGLWEIPRRLDAENFRRVIEALYICRGAEVAAPVAVFRADRLEDLAA
jgi:ABC-type iron transport system FetAB ATPase subunit